VLLLSFLIFGATGAAQTAASGGPQEKLETGKVIERVACIRNSEQSYAVYVPSTYSEARSWPVVFAFDPGARGEMPVELMKDAAERYGYIVLGSNNSRNGAWKPEMDAADAMLQDAQQRFNVDLKRIYFAGLSGGARVASQLAQFCKCAAGVLLSGAGFSQSSAPQKETTFPVFSAVGTLDFNYPELIGLQDKLEQAGYPHWLRVFEGMHEWAPADVMGEAFAWFRVQSMREKREPRNEDFIAGELKTSVAAAEKYSASGDGLATWRQYKQIWATFDGLVNMAEIHVQAETLAQSKPVRDALKRERSDFDDQQRMSDQILGAIQAGGNGDAPRSEEQNHAAEDARDLRVRTEKEKKPERAVVLKRALAGVFVGAIESGEGALDRKDYRTAANFLAVAAEARPDAQWPLRQLAVAQALNKDRKAAVETLRRAKATAKDSGEFLMWLQAEPAFQEMRTRSELSEFGTIH